MLKKCKANNAEAIQFHAPKLGVVEQLHTRYKSIKFHGNLKNECILLVGLTWNYPKVFSVHVQFAGTSSRLLLSNVGLSLTQHWWQRLTYPLAIGQ